MLHALAVALLEFDRMLLLHGVAVEVRLQPVLFDYDFDVAVGVVLARAPGPVHLVGLVVDGQRLLLIEKRALLRVLHVAEQLALGAAHLARLLLLLDPPLALPPLDLRQPLEPPLQAPTLLLEAVRLALPLLLLGALLDREHQPRPLLIGDLLPPDISTAWSSSYTRCTYSPWAFVTHSVFLSN